MSRGKRYDSEPKLNVKKVIAVIIAILVIIMFIVIIKKLLTNDNNVSNEEYFSVFTNNKWGVINKNGDTIVEPKYDEMIIIPNSKKDIFICTLNVDYANNKYKSEVLNAKGKKLFKDYDTVQAATNHDLNNNLYYEDNILIVSDKGKYGAINFEGKTVLKCEYEKIETLKTISNSLLIWKDGKVGLTDNTGVIIAEPKFSEIKPIEYNYQNGYITVNSEGKYGLLDFTGKVIFDNIYRDIKPIASTSLYIVKEFEKFKVVENNGLAVIEDFEDATDIIGDNVIIIKANKYGIVNKDKSEKVPAQYDELRYAFGDFYIAKKGDKYGIISLANQTQVDFTYTNITYREDAKFFELETSGSTDTTIMNSNFEVKFAGIISKVDVKNNYLKIRIGNDYKYFNLNFEEKTVQEIFPNNTLFLKKENDKFGYTDKSGNIKVSCIYDDAKEQNEYGFAAVKKDNLWGVINSEGTVIVEPKYSLDNNLIIEFIGKWHSGADINANYFTDI